MVPVTRPMLPPLEEFNQYLQEIWNNKWLTNNGPFHEKLEEELGRYLGVEHISLFSNGTLALITALQALRITGEVITTPYSFVATTHSLWWNNIKPIFVDIEPEFLNMDPARIEAAITPQTTAILPVHVYGNPCKVEEIQKIADTYNLHVIYDAAHAFGTRYKGQSILQFGDMSILSFHATKVFNTIEGGAIVCRDKKMKQQIDRLKNFGFAGETTVVAPGINAKMNEVQAAFGLLQLKYIDGAISSRQAISERYVAALKDIPGIRFIPCPSDAVTPYSYFPVLIESEKYGKTRDQVYDALKENGIYGRRYFYPLISEFPTYKGLPSANRDNLVVANRAADRILCLPMYHDLSQEEQDTVIAVLRDMHVK
jgi:dTDP-4-amino-4,6-dideoxygalactose transaminase